MRIGLAMIIAGAECIVKMKHAMTVAKRILAIMIANATMGHVKIARGQLLINVNPVIEPILCTTIRRPTL